MTKKAKKEITKKIKARPTAKQRKLAKALVAKKAKKEITKKIKARPTAKQRKLAKALVANEFSDKPEPIGQLLEKVGYSKNTAEAKPGEIIAQEGVQEALAEEAETM